MTLFSIILMITLGHDKKKKKKQHKPNVSLETADSKFGIIKTL